MHQTKRSVSRSLRLPISPKHLTWSHLPTTHYAVILA